MTFKLIKSFVVILIISLVFFAVNCLIIWNPTTTNSTATTTTTTCSKGDVYITNNSGRVIYDVFVKRSGNSNWGDDQVTPSGSNIPNGTTYNIYDLLLTPGYYDIVVVDDSGDTEPTNDYCKVATNLYLECKQNLEIEVSSNNWSMAACNNYAVPYQNIVK